MHLTEVQHCYYLLVPLSSVHLTEVQHCYYLLILLAPSAQRCMTISIKSPITFKNINHFSDSKYFTEALFLMKSRENVSTVVLFFFCVVCRFVFLLLLFCFVCFFQLRPVLGNVKVEQQLVHGPGIKTLLPPPPPPPPPPGIFGDNDFWIAQNVFSISACLQDELLCF